MKNICFKTIMVFGILLTILGCGKSDDDVPEENKIEITDESVFDSDVDALDYWDNSQLVWNDEFMGTSLSDANWSLLKYAGGQGNTEVQNYTADDNIEVSNGTLKITAKKIGDGQKIGEYTSARLHSKFAFTYGRIEIRAKLPEEKGNGLWATLWMLGNNFETVGFPTSGIINIANYVSHSPNEFFCSVISAASIQGGAATSISNPIYLETAEEAFHTYGVLWSDKYLKFYLDDIDNIIFSYKQPVDPNANNWPFSKSFYFVMNMAVGGEFGGVEGVDDTIFPTSMEIDYIRVYHAK